MPLRRGARTLIAVQRGPEPTRIARRGIRGDARKRVRETGSKVGRMVGGTGRFSWPGLAVQTGDPAQPGSVDPRAHLPGWAPPCRGACFRRLARINRERQGQAGQRARFPVDRPLAGRAPRGFLMRRAERAGAESSPGSSADVRRPGCMRGTGRIDQPPPGAFFSHDAFFLRPALFPPRPLLRLKGLRTRLSREGSAGNPDPIWAASILPRITPRFRPFWRPACRPWPPDAAHPRHEGLPPSARRERPPPCLRPGRIRRRR